MCDLPATPVFARINGQKRIKISFNDQLKIFKKSEIKGQIKKRPKNLAHLVKILFLNIFFYNIIIF